MLAGRGTDGHGGGVGRQARALTPRRAALNQKQEVRHVLPPCTPPHTCMHASPCKSPAAGIRSTPRSRPRTSGPARGRSIEAERGQRASVPTPSSTMGAVEMGGKWWVSVQQPPTPISQRKGSPLMPAYQLRQGICQTCCCWGFGKLPRRRRRTSELEFWVGASRGPALRDPDRDRPIQPGTSAPRSNFAHSRSRAADASTCLGGSSPSCVPSSGAGARGKSPQTCSSEPPSPPDRGMLSDHDAPELALVAPPFYIHHLPPAPHTHPPTYYPPNPLAAFICPVPAGCLAMQGKLPSPLWPHVRGLSRRRLLAHALGRALLCAST